jgi:hypothetical protein
VSHWDYKKMHQSAWKKLAQANGLTFTPGGFWGGVRVSGKYGQRYLSLETSSADGGNNLTCTHLALSAKKATNNYPRLTSAYLAQASLTVDDVVNLLVPKDWNYKLWGKVKANVGGQTLSYEQPGIETDVDFLQFLFDRLGELADAYLEIVALGSEVVPTLHKIATNDRHVFQPLATQLLFDISRETAGRLGHQAARSICPYCLARCQAHKVRVYWWQPVTYYACRMCSQSRKFLVGPLVATLDNRLTTERFRQDGILRVNWLTYRNLFDFDTVEIRQATDEDVERFAVQVGNDTDPLRKSHYKRISCVVSPECRLSPNTLRILAQMFGTVQMTGQQNHRCSPPVNQTYQPLQA